MLRLFPQYKKRDSRLLDGVWKFAADPQGLGEKEKWFQNFPENALDMVVPSCWNNTLGWFRYEGAAWYQTEFETSKDNLKLTFHAVTGAAEVYLDGEKLGAHYGGFTPFDFHLQNIRPGRHALVVRVDNTHNSADTIPLSHVDWYHYGGIIRSVELCQFEGAYIDRMKIDYELDGDLSGAVVTATLWLKNVTREQTLCLSVEGKELASEKILPGQETASISGFVKDLRLWDVGQGNLYTVTAAMEEDDLSDRVGFRELRVEKGRLLLNQKPVFLKGVNRHEEHPEWGFALPFSLMRRDLDIIKKLGCNAIRGSHYPNAPIFLDLLDQEGILFWEEIPMWGFPQSAIANPLVLERGRAMHQEMVQRDYNRPCVILWGLHNEIDTGCEESVALSEAFYHTLREYDKKRPVTYATDHPFVDRCYRFADIVSVNKYIGWYEDTVEDWGRFLEKFHCHLEAQGAGDKPLIISEFGAGAVGGCRSFEAPRWSENYQKEYLDKSLRTFFADEKVIGTYIWQFCDIRTAEDMEIYRPRSFNNKGLVDEYRRPKESFWKVQELYTEK